MAVVLRPTDAEAQRTYITKPGTHERELESRLRDYFSFVKTGVPESTLQHYYSPDHLIIGWDRMDSAQREVEKQREFRIYSTLSPWEKTARTNDEFRLWREVDNEKKARWLLEDIGSGISFRLSGRGVYADMQASLGETAVNVVADIVQKSTDVREVRTNVGIAERLGLNVNSSWMRKAVGSAFGNMPDLLSSPDAAKTLSGLSGMFQDIGYVFWAWPPKEMASLGYASNMPVRLENVKPVQTIVDELKRGEEGKQEGKGYGNVTYFHF